MARARVDWAAIPDDTWATRTDAEIARKLDTKPGTVRNKRKELGNPREPKRG